MKSKNLKDFLAKQFTSLNILAFINSLKFRASFSNQALGCLVIFLDKDVTYMFTI